MGRGFLPFRDSELRLISEQRWVGDLIGGSYQWWPVSANVHSVAGVSADVHSASQADFDDWPCDSEHCLVRLELDVWLSTTAGFWK
jgi:hypothetical protein